MVLPPGLLSINALSAMGIVGPAVIGALGALGRIASGLGLGGVFRWAKNNPFKAILGAEGIDLSTPGIDLPSPSDIPGVIAELGKGGLDLVKDLVVIPPRILSQFFGLGGDDGMSWATLQHGPVVNSWEANGVPFVQFADGWQAARKLTGVWSFWKPKKPVVYVPGGPMSRKVAQRMAKIYQRERKNAKKTFNLVEPKPRSSTPTVRITESGPGNVRVST
jgi:hypothetical protein